jgi:hypothetical protein
MTYAYELVGQPVICEEYDRTGHTRSLARGVPAYLPSFMRWCRVRFRSFLCFFLRIFLRRFLISDGKLLSLSLGSEEIPQVDSLHAEGVLQSNGAKSKRFRRCCHVRDQAQAPVLGHELQIADAGQAPLAI